MTAMLKPIALGVGAYVVSALGLWFVGWLILVPVYPSTISILPGLVTLVPLVIAGYVASRYTASRYVLRRVALAAIAGFVGFTISLLVARTEGHAGLVLILCGGAVVVAAIGGWLGTRHRNA